MLMQRREYDYKQCTQRETSRRPACLEEVTLWKVPSLLAVRVEQFPVAGDVAQFVQAPVTGMLPFGGSGQTPPPPPPQKGLVVYSIASPPGPCMVGVSSTSALSIASHFMGEQNYDFITAEVGQKRRRRGGLFLVSHFTDLSAVLF